MKWMRIKQIIRERSVVRAQVVSGEYEALSVIISHPFKEGN